jgi:predicted lysophospholipase L1 biosynthesis ABC-type transport system permease subunit
VRVQDAGAADRRYVEQVVRPRAAAALAVVFASIAVVAAAGGLFSVLSYSVGRRRREYGVRAAFGASPGQIRRVVWHDALVVAVSGLTIGVLFAAALARALASLQYGVTPEDPLSWSLVLGLIALTVAAASWAPARSAATVDPLVLLREEQHSRMRVSELQSGRCAGRAHGALPTKPRGRDTRGVPCRACFEPSPRGRPTPHPRPRRCRWR